LLHMAVNKRVFIVSLSLDYLWFHSCCCEFIHQVKFPLVKLMMRCQLCLFIIP